MAGDSTQKRHRVAVQSLPIHPKIISSLKRGLYECRNNTPLSSSVPVCIRFTAGLHYVPSVLECGGSELGRRTGLGESEVRALLMEASRSILQSSQPTTALQFYQSGVKQRNWGEGGM